MFLLHRDVELENQIQAYLQLTFHESHSCPHEALPVLRTCLDCESNEFQCSVSTRQQPVDEWANRLKHPTRFQPNKRRNLSVTEMIEIKIRKLFPVSFGQRNQLQLLLVTSINLICCSAFFRKLTSSLKMPIKFSYRASLKVAMVVCRCRSDGSNLVKGQRRKDLVPI